MGISIFFQIQDFSLSDEYDQHSLLRWNTRCLKHDVSSIISGKAKLEAPNFRAGLIGPTFSHRLLIRDVAKKYLGVWVAGVSYDL